MSPSDYQHTGEGVACSLHHPVPLGRVYHQSRMDQRRQIVSLLSIKVRKITLILTALPLQIIFKLCQAQEAQNLVT